MPENITILEELGILYKVNEEIKRNINLLYVFRDCGKEINVILVTFEDMVYCFGLNQNGVLGFGHNNSIEEFTVNEELSNKKIVDFKNSENHTVARTSDGKLYSWGTIGCSGNEEVSEISKPQLNEYLINENITSICCEYKPANYRYNISAALSERGVYYVWGECGNGLFISEPRKTQFKSFDDIFLTLAINNNSFRNGKYTENWDEIGSKLGEGSYGKVFKVGHKFRNTFFAMKKIQIFSVKYSFDESFRELDILSVLQEDNEFLVKYHDGWFEQSSQLINGNRIYANNPTIYIQMDLCETNLSDIQKEVKNDTKLFSNNSLTKMGYFVLSEIFVEVLEGVKYLHSKNIMHRDLHPDNILVKIRSNGNCIQIADFGYAKVHIMNKSNTQDRGHIRYMAPEVGTSRKYDTKADIYSLGRILQELFVINFTNEYGSDITSKYVHLEKICENMTNINPGKRNECVLILDDREKLCINQNEFSLKEELFNCSTFSNNYKSYVQKIIELKLLHKFSISSPETKINNLIDRTT